MKQLTKLLAAALMIGGATVASTAPAQAGIGISIGIGVPGVYLGYDYSRPCAWYANRDLPVPRRCFDYYRGIWGPGIYVDGDFIFRDRAHWYHWRDRPDYRSWRAHDWHGGGHDWHGGDHGPHGGDHHGDHDHGGHDHGGHDHGGHDHDHH